MIALVKVHCITEVGTRSPGRSDRPGAVIVVRISFLKTAIKEAVSLKNDTLFRDNILT